MEKDVSDLTAGRGTGREWGGSGAGSDAEKGSWAAFGGRSPLCCIANCLAWIWGAKPPQMGGEREGRGERGQQGGNKGATRGP